MNAWCHTHWPHGDAALPLLKLVVHVSESCANKDTLAAGILWLPVSEFYRDEIR